MIEKLVNSKTRLKILKLFLSHMDDRYYLRELERMLDESLSPLRRQLVKLTNIGILRMEEEANLKYYKLDKDFEGLEELRELVLGKEIASQASFAGQLAMTSGDGTVTEPVQPRRIPLATYAVSSKRIRFDLVALSFISVFVLITAIFMVYANTKNMKQVAKLIAGESGKASFAATPASNGEMMSKKWKVIPGNIPVLSSGETGEVKDSKEL